VGRGTKWGEGGRERGRKGEREGGESENEKGEIIGGTTLSLPFKRSLFTHSLFLGPCKGEGKWPGIYHNCVCAITQ